MSIKYTPKKCDEVAKEIVDCMELSDCLNLLIDLFSKDMQDNEELFWEQVKNYYIE